MKKLLALLLLSVLLSPQAQAWEATAGLGYSHRQFSKNDQLGAVSPAISLSPGWSNGLQASASWSTNVTRSVNLGAQICVDYNWLMVGNQSQYSTKTAGVVDTNALTTQTLSVLTKFQLAKWEHALLFFKPGIVIVNLTNGLNHIDTDTTAAANIELATTIGSKYRASLDVQAMLSPTIIAKHVYNLSLAVAFSISRVFDYNEHEPQVVPVVAEKVAVPLPPKPLDIAPDATATTITAPQLQQSPPPDVPQLVQQQQQPKSTKPHIRIVHGTSTKARNKAKQLVVQFIKRGFEDVVAIEQPGEKGVKVQVLSK